VDWEELPQAAAVVAAVAHDEFKNRPMDAILAKLAPNGVYVDVKNQADAAALRARGIEVWRL
jgi:UDP-N-acetyl-D-galactosamine dehydrogenase